MTLEEVCGQLRHETREGDHLALPGLCRVGARAYVARFQIGADLAARRLSEHLGGQWFPGRYSVTWQRGRESTWLLHNAALTHVQAARGACRALGIDEPPWTVGACCRALLRWVGAPQRPDRRNEALLSQGDWGYRLVAPGIYPDHRLLDLDAAYWHLLWRLPGLHPTVLRDRLIWHPVEPDAWSRWRELLVVIRDEKTVRNPLVGAMAGTAKAVRFYSRGEGRQLRPQPGPLRAAGLLVMRSTYEATGLECASSAPVYANTDCVVVPGGTRPRVWEGLGLPWSIRARGEADIQALCVYRVGDHTTGWYTGRGRWIAPPVRSPLPERLVSAEWL